MTLLVLILAMQSADYLKVYAKTVIPPITISAPKLADIANSAVSDPKTQYKMITTTLATLYDSDLPFVVFLEVRDSQEVTVFLQFHTGTLKGESYADLASSWLPPKTGDYELRAFAISNFTTPIILTHVSMNYAHIK